MINIQNLTFGYQKKQPLFENLSLELPEGKIYGLLGKNGAGKTSLLKQICGLLHPQHGSCLVDGILSAERLPSMLAQIFFIADEFELPAISGEKFVKLHAPFYPNFSKPLFESVNAEFEVDTNANLQKLSLGQRKKLMIAFALATRTKYLILDEPTNGLDIPSKAQFRKVMASAMDESRTVLLSTHQVRDLSSLIDHIVVLDNGKIVFNQDTYNISSKLAFSLATNIDGLDVVYKEEVMGGNAVIYRTNNNETEIDIELLFNGVTNNTKDFHSIFNS